MSGTCTQPEDPVWKVLGVDGWDWVGEGILGTRDNEDQLVVYLWKSTAHL